MSQTEDVMIRRSSGIDEVDAVAVEEPLEIRLAFEHHGIAAQRTVAITMRTPGDDADLAVGFLFGEGIVRVAEDVASVQHCGTVEVPNLNVIKVALRPSVDPQLSRLQRNFYTTSSCGVCGKSSLEALDVTGFAPVTGDATIDAGVVRRLDATLRERQRIFDATGGLHAAALFTLDGELVTLREDVGRHNAVDKLVGWALTARPDLSSSVLFLSGRASFELLQKALAARIPIVCAVGAPSSLAVALAERFGITLLGFVRNGRYNIYSHPQRVAEVA